MKIELSYRQAILLRGILNTSSKSLMKIGARPHAGWKYYEWKAEQLRQYAKIIDKKIKVYESSGNQE
jgi:hypothetical protein